MRKTLLEQGVFFAERVRLLDASPHTSARPRTTKAVAAEHCALFRGLLGLEHAGYYFTRGIPREGIHKVDVTRDGVLCEVVFHPVADGIFGKSGTLWRVFADDPYGDALKHGLVFHTARIEICDACHGLKDFFDRAGIHVFSSHDDHVVGTSEHKEVVVLIDVTAVADLDQVADALDGDGGVGVSGE